MTDSAAEIDESHAARRYRRNLHVVDVDVDTARGSRVRLCPHRVPVEGIDDDDSDQTGFTILAW